MKDDFFKFPSTPHLATLAGVEVRDDKILPEAELCAFLKHKLIVEEKVDGANLGISFNSEGSICLQNRGTYLNLPGSGQWKKLEQWLNPRMDKLFEVLTDRHILFGEWCYAQHSVYYNRLPDWFLGFDLYDKQVCKFISTERRNETFIKLNVAGVPIIKEGYFTVLELKQLFSMSRISDQPSEGLYLRIDHGDWLLKRAKIVRSDFIQSVVGHWSRSAIKPNQLKPKKRV